MASSQMLAGSKQVGLGANEAPAECYPPWSTGSSDRYPVLARRPVLNGVCIERSTPVRSILGCHHPIHVVRTRQMQRVLRDGGAGMAEQTFRLVAEQLDDVCHVALP